MLLLRIPLCSLYLINVLLVELSFGCGVAGLSMAH